jgi:uncharacterized protein (AIM24 family)
MEVTGSGDLFVAHNEAEIHLVYLEGDSLTINGINVLAFDSNLEWDIKMIHGMGHFTRAGWFNMVISGTGWVAMTSFGTPVVLQTSEAPTYADFDAVVAWTTNLKTDFKSSFNVKSVFGWGSGEAFQMSFEGDGMVVVQASEGRPVPNTPEKDHQKK